MSETQSEHTSQRQSTDDDDDDYVLLGDAKDLTRNGKATATEAGRGKGR